MLKPSIQANITWPLIPGLGHINCNGSHSCREIHFPEPSANIPYYLDCNSDYECRESDIYCPSNSSCSITCTNYRSCYRVCVLRIHIYLANNQTINSQIYIAQPTEIAEYNALEREAVNWYVYIE